MRWTKRISALIPVFSLLVTSFSTSEIGSVRIHASESANLSSPVIEDGVTTWDKIKFGSYYQDAEVHPAEPIKWRVLSVNGDDAFLLADEILDAKPYHEEWEDVVTWETCTLRKWLNEDFYNEAFDDEEKRAVRETTVVNDDNLEYGTDGGNDTKDKVYLLSIAEAKNEAYGFDTEFRVASETRKAKNTDYAKLNGTYTNTDDGTAGNGYWWLRSPGNDSYYAAYVNYVGFGYCNGNLVANGKNGVRPALHINLKSSKVEDAGEIDSEGKVTISSDGINAPRGKNGVTTWDCVYFGSYRQNCTVEKQAVEWRVLSVDGGDAFMLADKILDAKPYHEEWEDVVTWETCTLRKWLNEDFYNEAFDEEEKKAVREAMVVNSDNPEYGTEGGNNTKDKVYLLSIAEAKNEAYGFDTEFKKDSKTREAKNTDYAKLNNVYSSIVVGNGDWWLRSPGDYYVFAANVAYDGYGNSAGDSVDYSGNGVRPALHINLSSSSWRYAGKVNSKGEVTDEPAETDRPDTTDEPVKTDRPDTTYRPVKTDRPDMTDSPVETDRPKPTQKPTQGPLQGSIQEPSQTASTQAPPQTVYGGNGDSNRVEMPANTDNNPAVQPPVAIGNHKNVTPPGKVKLSVLNNFKGRKIAVMFKSLKGVSGYQIAYQDNRKLKKPKYKTTTRTAMIITKLKLKKTYYVKVRAYKVVNGKKVYGKWSKIKHVKIRK